MKLLSVAAVIALAGTASADTKSWTAVKGMLPDNVNLRLILDPTAERERNRRRQRAQPAC